MPTPTPIVHAHKPLRYDEVHSHARGATVLSTVNISNAAHTQVSVSTTNASGLGWTVQTATYSYDGLVHFDSYVSDI